MKKSLLLSLSLLLVAAPICAEQAAPSAPSGIWKFEKGTKAKKIVSLLAMLARPGADTGHIDMLGKAMGSARAAAEIRRDYDAGKKTPEAIKQDMQGLVGDVTDMLEFLALAKPLVEDSFRLSPIHDTDSYKSEPLLLEIVEMQRKKQEERLAEAIEDLDKSLQILDQIRAIRQGLIFNVPGKVKAVFGENAAHLFDPTLF